MKCLRGFMYSTVCWSFQNMTFDITLIENSSQVLYYARMFIARKGNFKVNWSDFALKG